MSGSDKKQSSGCSGGDGGGGGGGSGGSDEEDEIDGLAERSSLDEESRKRKGKGVSLFRFSRAKKKLLLLQMKRSRKKGSLVNSRLSGRRGGDKVISGCLCIKQPMTLESSAESPTSDPNSKEFTYDMMRGFIEKNDFYAGECNPHLDDK